MSIDHRGFVALFKESLDKKHIQQCVTFWLETFEKLEQVLPDSQEVGTLPVTALDEIMWEDNMTFRVVSGDDFSWVYLTKGRRIMETSGFAGTENEAAMALKVIVGLPGVQEVIDEHNEKRLDQLEREGLM